jgi:hypothetical protein
MLTAGRIRYKPYSSALSANGSSFLSTLGVVNRHGQLARNSDEIAGLHGPFQSKACQLAPVVGLGEAQAGEVGRHGRRRGGATAGWDDDGRAGGRGRGEGQGASSAGHLGGSGPGGWDDNGRARGRGLGRRGGGLQRAAWRNRALASGSLLAELVRST